MIYQMEYASLYLELKRRLKVELGIEVPDDWERRVCLGETNVPLGSRVLGLVALKLFSVVLGSELKSFDDLGNPPGTP